MGNIEFIIIPITITAIIALLSWIVIGAKGHWWMKAGVAAATIFCGIGIWEIIGYMPGWPATTGAPENTVRVLWAEIEEPNLDKPDGGIYIVVQDIQADSKRTILGYTVDMSKPRMFEIPYSKEAHKQAQGIQNEIRKGARVYGKLSLGKGGKFKGEGQGGKEGKGGKRGNGVGGNNQHQTAPFFYRMRPPKLPEKIR